MGGVALFVFGLAILISAIISSFSSQAIGLVLVIGIIAGMLSLIWYSLVISGQMLLFINAFLEGKDKIISVKNVASVFRVSTALLAQFILFIPFVVVFIALIVCLFNVFDKLMPTSIVFMIVFSVGLYIVAGFGFFAFTNIFAVSSAVAVFENKYFFKAVSRSWQLVKHDYWRILGIRVFWYIAVFIASLCGQGVFVLINALLGYIMSISGIGIIASFLITPFTGFAGPLLVTLIISPLIPIMQSMIYYNRCMEAEGFDIKHKLNKLSEVS
jgi:hypothetical protein